MANPQGFPMETLLGRCRQQKASDQMLLFVRAVCAAGLIQDSDSLGTLQAVLAADGVACRFVFTYASRMCSACILTQPA